MKDFNLKISEIKKAERFAANKSNEPCFLAAWSYSGVDDLGWADVLCEMGNTNNGEPPVLCGPRNAHCLMTKGAMNDEML